MKYFLYARKSTDEEDRQVLSIEAQLAELKEFAAKEKLEIAASYTETKTAKEPGRMKFGEMLASLEKGEADGIISWHPDRLARNPIDGGKIIYLVDTGKIKSLRFPTFWFEDTPQGKFMLNIAFGQSKYFIDNLSENVKRGLRQKLRRGEYPGWAPLGYLNDYRNHTIVVDKIKHKLLKRIFEFYATGNYTLKSLTDKFNELGLTSKTGKSITPGMLHFTLKNPFYYGVFKYKGELHKGNHEPIITKKLFDEVQAVMKTRGRQTKIKKIHNYVFTNFMKCGTCGCAITAEKQKGHIYYRCTKKKGVCDEKYLREEILAEQLKSEIKKVSLPDGWGEKMLKQLEIDEKESIKSKQGEIMAVKDKIDILDSRLDKLLDSHLDGLIKKETYLKKKEKLINEKVGLEKNLKSVRQNGNNWLEPMRDFILKLIKAKKTASDGDLHGFKTFLKNIGSNFILKGKKFAFLAEFEWTLARNFRAYPNWLPIQIPLKLLKLFCRI
jgi:DNA invertase Pin-like site-specific DNA recombinase